MMSNNRTQHHIGWYVSGVAALMLVVLVALFAPPPRSTARRNQTKLTLLLADARPQFTATDPPRIEQVKLGSHMTLTPEYEQVAVGYTLTLHVRSGAFSIEARPVKPGETGLFSFFRDEAGEIRFEPELGIPASAESRHWNQPLPAEQR